MPTTPNIKLPLYTDEETPDLSTTGHYNAAMGIVDDTLAQHQDALEDLSDDLVKETTERKAADTALGTRIANEAAERVAADAALGSRIDNAETEISANSADLTGIKGLTYGDDRVQFLENENGEYTSPALEEIAEQISQSFTTIEIPSTITNIDADTLAKIEANWPYVVIVAPDLVNMTVIGQPGPQIFSKHSAFSYPFADINDKWYSFIQPYVYYRPTNNEPAYPMIQIPKTAGGHIVRGHTQIGSPFWGTINAKPFSTIGSGLKVVGDALTVDTAAIPTGITGSTSWGEIEQS